MAKPVMTGRIVVLGGAGQLGRAAALAFRAAGWQVASLVRASSAAGAAPGTEIIEVDARDTASVIAAAAGADGHGDDVVCKQIHHYKLLPSAASRRHGCCSRPAAMLMAAQFDV